MRRLLIFLFIALLGCVFFIWTCNVNPPTPRPPPRLTSAPVINLSNCSRRLSDSPQWNPPHRSCRSLSGGGTCHSAWRTCKVTDWIDGVAVEKSYMARENRRAVYDLASGGPRPPYHYINFALLYRDDDGEIQRRTLTSQNCQPPGAGPCSHDELFRRDFDLAVDGDRIAISSIPSDIFSLSGDSDHARSATRARLQWVHYLDRSAPETGRGISWSATALEAMTPQELLDLAPLTRDHARTHRGIIQARRIIRDSLKTPAINSLTRPSP